MSNSGDLKAGPRWVGAQSGQGRGSGFTVYILKTENEGENNTREEGNSAQNEAVRILRSRKRLRSLVHFIGTDDS